METSAIRQVEAAECGLACLAIVSGILGARIELSELRRKHPVSNRGLTLTQVMSIATALQMSSRPVKSELNELRLLRTPAILHWGLNHFVVLLKAGRGHVTIQDPSRGIRRVSMAEASDQFSGVAIELSRTPDFKRRKDRSLLKLTSLFRFTPPIVGGLVQTFILSLLLQAYVVASPFYMQLAIDEAALKGDRTLLGALAVGFALFGLFNIGATLLRGVALQKIAALLGWEMTSRLFHHMLRLPLTWFQRRRLADSLSRFESLQPVRQLIASGLVGSVIDGLLSVVTLIMMIAFAWKLAVIAAAGLLAYVLIRLIAVPATIQLAGDALVASVSEQGKRIETLRAIQTIKVMGAETQREADWSNRFAETIRTNQANAFANLGFSSVQGVTDTLANVAIIYVGANMIIDNTLSVGVLFAFMAYKTQFLNRAQGLFETIVNWRMLDLHSDRIADIALTPQEPGLNDVGFGHHEMQGAIEAVNLSFRYAPQDPYVFHNISFSVGRGEFVAITGPSGVGKSTLMKVLCGLYPASSGDVRIDGLALSSWGAKSLRQNLGVVLQDDELLAGSIAENVAFFAEEIDMDWVWACLASAGVDEEVRAMQMRAESFVGDMGSALSGGQKQRVLLARALYKRPRILVLDEATSHLDMLREQQINEAIRSQAITRLVVAHRPETIAAADRVLRLSGGRLIEASPGVRPTRSGLA